MKIIDAVELANRIRRKGRPLTFLIGAGFSASAGIPLADEMVRDLKKLLGGAVPGDVDKFGAYASLMGMLNDSDERHRFVADAIAKGNNRINWAHLFLATLIEARRVKRVLTTNFDPLMVRALAMTGQPIQTFDLTSHGRYTRAVLDPPVVVYLHGQVHSVLMVNSAKEMRAARATYTEVLSEAVQDSSLFVVGYSGVNDILFDKMKKFRAFPYGLYWSNFEPELAPDVHAFLSERDGANYLTGYAADHLMRELVIDGFKMKLPKLIGNPIAAVREIVTSLSDFPQDQTRATGDPREVARRLLVKLETLAETLPEGKALRINEAAMQDNWELFDQWREGFVPDRGDGADISRIIGDGMLRRSEHALRERRFEDAGIYLEDASRFGVADEAVLQALRAVVLMRQSLEASGAKERDRLFAEARALYEEALRVEPTPSAPADLAGQQRRGNAHWNWALGVWEHARLLTDNVARIELLKEADSELQKAEKLSPENGDRCRVWAMVSNDRAALAQAGGDARLAKNLWERADELFKRALTLDGADHKTNHNWGMAIADRAALLYDAALFKEARQKLERALKGNPEPNRVQKTYLSLGNTILGQAARKLGAETISELLGQAGDAYRTALRMDPGFGAAHFGLAAIYAQGNPYDLQACLAELELWRRSDATACAATLDVEKAFDPVRDASEFKLFVASLGM